MIPLRSTVKIKATGKIGTVVACAKVDGGYIVRYQRATKKRRAVMKGPWTFREDELIVLLTKDPCDE